MQKEEKEKQDILEKNFRLWRSRNIKSLCLRKFGRGNQCGKKTENVGKKTMLWEYWRKKGYLKSGEREKVGKKMKRENYFEKKITVCKEKKRDSKSKKRK